MSNGCTGRESESATDRKVEKRGGKNGRGSILVLTRQWLQKRRKLLGYALKSSAYEESTSGWLTARRLAAGWLAISRLDWGGAACRPSCCASAPAHSGLRASGKQLACKEKDSKARRRVLSLLCYSIACMEVPPHNRKR